MRGDRLSRKWRIIGGIEVSQNGLTVAETATFPSNLEAFQAATFPLYPEKAERTSRRALVDTFRFKDLPPFT